MSYVQSLRSIRECANNGCWDWLSYTIILFICSILSSDQNIELDTQICFAGEIGLSGEIRAVNRIEQRIAEAEKLGYKQIVISKYNNLNSKDFKIKILKFGKIEEVFRLLFS